MHDEWRLTLVVTRGAVELAEDLREDATGDVDVRQNGNEVVVYGASRELVESVAGPELAGTGSLHRWRRDDGWVDPAAWTEPPAEEEPFEWLVAARFRRHDDARRLARELRDKGRAVSRHWRRVTIWGLTEQEARALADRLRLHLPRPYEVKAELATVPGGPQPSWFDFLDRL